MQISMTLRSCNHFIILVKNFEKTSFSLIIFVAMTETTKKVVL